MNQRIKELMIQAMIETGRLEDVQATYQRFAELIVQDCLDVCDAYGMPDGTSPVARIISKVIKHKFGMDE